MSEENILSLGSRDRQTGSVFACSRESQYDDLEALMPDIHDLAKASQSAVSSTFNLQHFLGHRDPALRRAAAKSLSSVLLTAGSPIASEASGPNTVSFKMGRAFEMNLALLGRHLAIFRDDFAWFRSIWTYFGLGLTLVSAVCIAKQNWWAAFIFLSLRTVVSVSLGRDGNLPFDSGEIRAEHHSRILLRCVVGHLCDAVVLLAIAWALVVDHRSAWAAAAAVTACLMLAATMYRISALQVGVQLYRLQFERVMRNGVLLVGLFLAARFQSHVPLHGLPIIAFAGAGALIYAIGESVRTAQQIHHQDERIGDGDSEVMIVVRENDRSYALRSAVLRGVSADRRTAGVA